MKHKNYIDIDIELLKKLYTVEKLRIDYLAEKVFFVSGTKLRTILKQQGIPKNTRPDKIDIDIELLKELYINQKKSLQYLGREVFHCSFVTLINRMEQHNIPRRKKYDHMLKK